MLNAVDERLTISELSLDFLKSLKLFTTTYQYNLKPKSELELSVLTKTPQAYSTNELRDTH